MSVKTYAVMDCDVSPVSYLTAGKEYEVLGAWCGDDEAFEMVSDSETCGVYLWKDCAHLHGGNWRRIEREIDTSTEI